MVSTDGTPVDPRSELDEVFEDTNQEATSATIDEETSETNDSAEPINESVVDGQSTAVAPVGRTRRPKPSRIDRTVMEFQPDVVELEHKKVPGGARWTLYASIALIISAISWAFWAEVDRMVQCEGELIPTEAPILIQPPIEGKIIELHAQFNDIVRPGDLLVSLDPTYSQADVDKLKKQKVGWEAKIARLQAELSQTDFDLGINAGVNDWEVEKITYQERKSKMEAEIKRFEAERKKIESEQEGNEISIAAREKIVNMSAKQVEHDRKLAEGRTLSMRDFERTQMNHLNSKFQLELEKSRRTDFIESLNVNSKTKEAYVAEARSMVSDELVGATQKLNDVVEELRKSSYAVKSSQFRVSDEYGDIEYTVVQKTDKGAGSAAARTDTIYRLMPLNTEFEVKIKIEGKDIARIRGESGSLDLAGNSKPTRMTMVSNPPRQAGSDSASDTDSENPDSSSNFEGDLVRVKLASFPFQRHGTLEGRLRAVSEGTFTEERGMAQAVFYEGRVRLTSVNLKEVPDDFRLVPGMACTAEIKVGKRRVIDYFIYPLVRHLESSIREP